ncbi:MAG: DUF86 domain-containing protein [Phycisphaerales bacterium]|nr:DUF86 domain-containing protein [Phycisphaerales bacterium]
MLDAARRAHDFAVGSGRDGLAPGEVPTLGLIKCIEIIGEAANHVSDATTSCLPGIPWRSIVAMRHRTIHGYDDVNLDIVWDTATRALPGLIAALQIALENWPPSAND